MPNPAFFFRHKRPALALCGMPSLLTSCYNKKFFTSDQYFNAELSLIALNVPNPAFFFRYKRPALALCGMLSLLTTCYNNKFFTSDQYFNVELSLIVPDPVFLTRHQGPAPEPESFRIDEVDRIRTDF